MFNRLAAFRPRDRDRYSRNDSRSRDRGVEIDGVTITFGRYRGRTCCAGRRRWKQGIRVHEPARRVADLPMPRLHRSAPNHGRRSGASHGDDRPSSHLVVADQCDLDLLAGSRTTCLVSALPVSAKHGDGLEDRRREIGRRLSASERGAKPGDHERAGTWTCCRQAREPRSRRPTWPRVRAPPKNSSRRTSPRARARARRVTRRAHAGRCARGDLQPFCIGK